MLADLDSEGQRRQMALHQGRRDRCWRSVPILWAGVGLVRHGAEYPALVRQPGDGRGAATRIPRRSGSETIIASGLPTSRGSLIAWPELLFPALGIGRISATPAGREFRTAQWQAGRTSGDGRGAKGSLTPPTEAPVAAVPWRLHELRAALVGPGSCRPQENGFPMRSVPVQSVAQRNRCPFVGADAVAADAIGGQAVGAQAAAGPRRLGSGQPLPQPGGCDGGSATAQAGGE